MNAIVGVTVLLLVLVGGILAVAGELGKGGEMAKSALTLLVLTGISGYIAALASGSI